MVFVFMDSIVLTKMQVSLQKYAAGAGSSPASKNITRPNDKGYCFTGDLRHFLLKQEVIKEHMPRSLQTPYSLLSGPDGQTASVKAGQMLQDTQVVHVCLKVRHWKRSETL